MEKILQWDFHGLQIYCTLFIVGMTKCKTKTCVWKVKSNRRKMGAGFLLGKLKESDCFADLGIERRIILR